MSSAEAKPRHAVQVPSKTHDSTLSKNYRLLTPTSCRCLTLAVDNFGTVNSYHLPKRYRMTFRQESHSIAPVLILAFYRRLLALKRITFTLDYCEVPPHPSKMVTVVTDSRKVPIPTGISIRLKVYHRRSVASPFSQ